jgi:hypothetical protein
VEEKGAFVAWGCEVSVSKDLGDIQRRGVNVYTTRGEWTYTHSGGTGALGPREKERTTYGNIWDFTLSNVTFGFDPQKGEKNLRDSIVDAHNKVNGTP